MQKQQRISKNGESTGTKLIPKTDSLRHVDQLQHFDVDALHE